MRKFVETIAIATGVLVAGITATFVSVWRILREWDDAEGEAVTSEGMPHLPPLDPPLGSGRVIDLRGQEYEFDKNTNTYRVTGVKQ